MDAMTDSHATLVTLVMEQQATITRLEQRIRDLEDGVVPSRRMPGHKPAYGIREGRSSATRQTAAQPGAPPRVGGGAAQPRPGDLSTVWRATGWRLGQAHP